MVLARDGGIHFAGTRGGLLVRLDQGEDFQRLKERLAEKLAAAPRFFHGSTVTLDVGSRALTTEQLLELEAMFTSRYGLRVLQVVNGAEGEEAAPPPAARPAEEPPREDVVLVRRTVRSGQRIAYDGTIVVLGDVNPGAELAASGDVLVLGALRGVVHAGARGNERAVVVAVRLQPTQLRIANVIGRAPDEGGGPPPGPEFARIRDGEIVIEPFTGGGCLERGR